MQSNTSAQDKTSQRNNLQREMIMKESDLKKVLAEKTKLEGEIRELKKDESRIRIEMENKQGQIKKIEQEAMMMEAELKNLKKKMNLL